MTEGMVVPFSSAKEEASLQPAVATEGPNSSCTSCNVINPHVLHTPILMHTVPFTLPLYALQMYDTGAIFAYKYENNKDLQNLSIIYSSIENV
jgi:hypothetical protein